ncbi:hypothetical protein ACWF94_22935 [Streptomyces sp. NPDC055078]
MTAKEAVRHPVRALRARHERVIDACGCGLVGLALVGAFVIGVLTWLVVQFAAHFP